MLISSKKEGGGGDSGAPEQTENEGHNSSLGLASHTACAVAADSVLLGQLQS